MVPFKRRAQVYILINNHWHCTFFLFAFFTYCACFLSVNITLMIAMAPVQQKNKKLNLKFKLSVVKDAEENSGEAAARRFPAGTKRVRDWRKNKTELQRPSKEDRAMARQGVCHECWLAKSFPPPQQLHLQKRKRRTTIELNAYPKLPHGPK